MTAVAKTRPMTVPDFLRWEGTAVEGRYELVDGQVLAMSPERARHVDAKMNAWEMLRNAVRNSGLDWHVKGDGMTVVIDEHTARKPDVSIQCSAVDPEATVLDNPIVVVEVVSPSSERSDTGAKVADYFRVPGIRHYLIIDPYGRSVIRHSRSEAGGSISTEIHLTGEIALDPPGLSVAAEDLLGSDANAPLEKK